MTHRPITAYLHPADRTFWPAHATIFERTRAANRTRFIMKLSAGISSGGLRRFLMFFDYHDVDERRAPR